MKQKLRQEYKAIRQQLSMEQIEQYSLAISKQLFALPVWQTAKTIMLYLSFQNEVCTDYIFKQGWTENKIMGIPICHTHDHTMHLSRLNNFAQLTANKYGIRELPEEKQELILPEQIDLCLIPGIVFDTQGNRIGFGAGYYDRYLPQLRADVPKIALAYQCQISPAILPTDIYDLPMNYILTETKIYQI